MTEPNLIRVYFTEDELRWLISRARSATWTTHESAIEHHRITRKLESHLPENLGLEGEAKGEA